MWDRDDGLASMPVKRVDMNSFKVPSYYTFNCTDACTMPYTYSCVQNTFKNIKVYIVLKEKNWV